MTRRASDLVALHRVRMANSLPHFREWRLALDLLNNGDLVFPPRHAKEGQRALETWTRWTGAPLRIKVRAEKVPVALIQFLKVLNVEVRSHDGAGNALNPEQERSRAAARNLKTGTDSERRFAEYCEERRWLSVSTKYLWRTVVYRLRLYVPRHLRKRLEACSSQLPPAWKDAFRDYRNEVPLSFGHYAQVQGRGLLDQCVFVDGKPSFLVAIKSSASQHVTGLQREALAYFKSRGIPAYTWWPGSRLTGFTDPTKND